MVAGFAVGDTIVSPGPLMSKFIAGAGTGNFAKPTNPSARFHLVRVKGPGGAGGGCIGAGSGQSEGGGGGGGGYVERWYLDSELASTEPYVVGAGGTGVSGANGNNGSAASTFKTMSAGAGGGGQVMTSTTGNGSAVRGAGGSASGGDVNAPGSDGGPGRVLAGQAIFNANGGACANGGGAAQFPNFVAAAGAAGKAVGGGGSGAFGATANLAGGNGADGDLQIVSVF